MRAKLEQLRDWIAAEILHEQQCLRDIGGPTGMRNSLSSALGLTRNDIRQQTLARIDAILASED